MSLINPIIVIILKKITRFYILNFKSVNVLSRVNFCSKKERCYNKRIQFICK